MRKPSGEGEKRGHGLVGLWAESATPREKLCVEMDGPGSEEARKVPKIVIPKIVLKLGHATGDSSPSHPNDMHSSIKSNSAQALVREQEAAREPFVSLKTMVQKVNYSAYRSIENLLEM